MWKGSALLACERSRLDPQGWLCELARWDKHDRENLDLPVVPLNSTHIHMRMNTHTHTQCKSKKSDDCKREVSCTLGRVEPVQKWVFAEWRWCSKNGGLGYRQVKGIVCSEPSQFWTSIQQRRLNWLEPGRGQAHKRPAPNACLTFQHCLPTGSQNNVGPLDFPLLTWLVWREPSFPSMRKSKEIKWTRFLGAPPGLQFTLRGSIDGNPT